MSPGKKKKILDSLLTRIRASYTLSNTKDGNYEEVDEVMVRQFLNTLAEISLAIASRKKVANTTTENTC
ncbi:MAG: hypothetical protein JW967_01150 [Dehalococcoidales bacterium]|nr:hypothetical protein [Dehalococcoidales bacterium]